MNSFQLTYPGAFSDFTNTVNGVVASYDSLISNSIASDNTQLGEVQKNIDTCTNNIKMYVTFYSLSPLWVVANILRSDDVNIAGIAIEAGIAGFTVAATAAEDEAELAELIVCCF